MFFVGREDSCRMHKKAQVRPVMEYSSFVWAGASPSLLSLLDSVQKRVVKLLNADTQSELLTSLVHRRNVASLCVFYKYVFGVCSGELKSKTVQPLRETWQTIVLRLSVVEQMCTGVHSSLGHRCCGIHFHPRSSHNLLT